MSCSHNVKDFDNGQSNEVKKLKQIGLWQIVKEIDEGVIAMCNDCAKVKFKTAGLGIVLLGDREFEHFSWTTKQDTLILKFEHDSSKVLDYKEYLIQYELKESKPHQIILSSLDHNHFVYLSLLDSLANDSIPAPQNLHSCVKTKADAICNCRLNLTFNCAKSHKTNYQNK